MEMRNFRSVTPDYASSSSRADAGRVVKLAISRLPGVVNNRLVGLYDTDMALKKLHAERMLPFWKWMCYGYR